MFHSFCCQLALYMHISEEVSRARDTHVPIVVESDNQVACIPKVYWCLIALHTDLQFVNPLRLLSKYTQQVDQLLT